MELENSTTSDRLQELGGSKYEIADGQSDIRGWDVKDDNSNTLGEVKELLFDEASRKVRYIILELEKTDSDSNSRDVLIPIGLAQLDKDDDDVFLPEVTSAQLRSLPAYEKGNVGSDTENTIRSAFVGAGAAGLAGTASTTGVEDDFYNHQHFNDENLYRGRLSDNAGEQTTIPIIQEEIEIGKRQVEKGGIRLRTRIVENPVEEDITLREEKVNVVRSAVDRTANSADLQEEVIELTELKEVPVITKEARVVEEISLNKEVTERDESIRDTVKNTEVDIEEIDDDGKS